MNIYRDTIVRTQVFVGYKRSHKPTTIVIHGTAGGGTLNWWRTASLTSNDPLAKRHLRGVGLTHYLILTNGKIIEVYDPATRWVYHSSQGEGDALTIGIELENKSSTNANEYTPAQYQAVGALIFMLMEKFAIKLNAITTHDTVKISLGQLPKGCPGKNFKMQKIQDNLKTEEVTYVDL